MKPIISHLLSSKNVSTASQPPTGGEDDHYQKLQDEATWELSKCATDEEETRIAQIYVAKFEELNRPYTNWEAKSLLYKVLRLNRKILDKDGRWATALLKTIEGDDRTHHCGNSAFNIDTKDDSLYPPYVIYRSLSFRAPKSLKNSEGGVEKTVGGLLKGIVVGKGMKDRE